MLSSLSYLAAVIWGVIALLPWRPWGTRECIAADSPAVAAPWPDITVLIPARDEAESIIQTLHALAAQGPLTQIILIDDQSTDGTAALARGLALPRLQVIDGVAPPPGWSGKLWALQQGFAQVTTPHTLLLDADIELRPGILPALRRKLSTEEYALVSVMAALTMASWWERLLLPPFIYFFKMLYPFALANGPRRWIAAAAGGCILLKTETLRALGGFEALRGALIDDCTLARLVKARGGRTWLGLSRDVCALRPYRDLASIWNMVARTAFTQLRYSSLLLLLCTTLLFISFCVPVLGLWSPAVGGRIAAATALLLMFGTYVPVLRYYQRPLWWLPSLPLAGLLYLAMTWSSAIRYWRGERSRWKSRVYSRTDDVPNLMP